MKKLDKEKTYNEVYAKHIQEHKSPTYAQFMATMAVIQEQQDAINMLLDNFDRR